MPSVLLYSLPAPPAPSYSLTYVYFLLPPCFFENSHSRGRWARVVTYRTGVVPCYRHSQAEGASCAVLCWYRCGRLLRVVVPRAGCSGDGLRTCMQTPDSPCGAVWSACRLVQGPRRPHACSIYLYYELHTIVEIIGCQLQRRMKLVGVHQNYVT